MLKNLFRLNEQRYYARKCKVCEITKKEKKDFLNKYHRQGTANSSVDIGLYYKDELVSVMTFGKPRFNKEYQWELIRFCSKGNVVGGASKLFKYFTKNYKGSVLSYADIAKTKGNIYKTLGFSFIKTTEPNYVWWKSSKLPILPRYKTQMKNEVEIMHEKGYSRIYDCGNNLYGYGL